MPDMTKGKKKVGSFQTRERGIHMKLSEIKVELLAPAGKWEVLVAVIDAGADAVYLAGKRFNMRMHRSDFNFTDEQLALAVKWAHEREVKIYVTVNNLISDAEMNGLYDYLKYLQDIKVDAIIVHDLGVINLVNEMKLDIPMHASTMMNVHSVEMATGLKNFGVSRIITSRDITLAQVKEIGEKAGIETEYFVHGDMCVSQSGQCHSSGVIFGKSANRGECMKPCRWKYSIVESNSGEEIGDLPNGYLLAMKDMCMFQHIPELIQAGVSSFKIEGRMRHQDFLTPVIALYRKAIDDYLRSPFTYWHKIEDFEKMYKERVRDFTTAMAFSHATSNVFDYSGSKEPLFLSRGAVEKSLTTHDLNENPFETVHDTPKTNTSLAVKVSTINAVRKSLNAGADYVYLGAEISPLRGEGWTEELLQDAVKMTHDLGKKIVFGTPRICTSRELSEIEWLFDIATSTCVDGVLVHNLGALQCAKQFDLDIFADFSFNILNAGAIKMLEKLGVKRVTSSLESSFSDLVKLASRSTIPVECVVHGALPGMLLEHCLPAMLVTKTNAKSGCRLPCRYINYALKDEKGEIRTIEVDQYCRNHIMFSTDLCVLPYLNTFVKTGVEVFRIEAQYYDDAVVETVVRRYRNRLDQCMDNPDLFYPIPESEWEELVEKSPRSLSLCAYAQDVTQSRSTLEVMKTSI
ncbi:MAG: U32 family peptidase [Candidatus Scalindua sp. SCAELEC01]|nr:MAG: U32 family peptidase [Candidatus Scalindua sp.]NOG83111.1 U32 family peptidase [Planctomycetota bacterium]RZV75871.1 MAG: U32 family peptidase [Candidatus Scalindua sp. SCAELEC01]